MVELARIVCGGERGNSALAIISVERNYASGKKLAEDIPFYMEKKQTQLRIK